MCRAVFVCSEQVEIIEMIGPLSPFERIEDEAEECVQLEWCYYDAFAASPLESVIVVKFNV